MSGVAPAGSRDPATGEVVAEVRELRVEISRRRDVVSDVSFDIRAGQITGLVGESGSGKTTVSMAMLGYARRGAKIVGGTLKVLEEDILRLSDAERRRYRGNVVAYVPQDPAAALNPALRVSRQLSEVIEAHEPQTPSGAVDARMREVLAEVGLSAAETLLKFPHQLSGGQQQRVGIAMALMLKPNLLVLDEPTTGLDVTTQARILQLLRTLCTSHRIGALYVTHDLSVVAEIADRVIVMYAGRIVESGTLRQVFREARHPYTRALLKSVPDVRFRTELSVIPGKSAPPGQRPPGCAFHPRCQLAVEACRTGDEPPLETVGSQLVRCIRAAELPPRIDHSPLPAPGEQTGRTTLLSVRQLTAHYGRTTAVLRGVDFDLLGGECLAIVGESGSGKSTLSRCLVGLHAQQEGAISLRGDPLAASVRARTASQRQKLQYIFQSPFSSLNPRKSVADILSTARRTFFGRDRATAGAAVAEAMDLVGLSPRLGSALPDELSGGERQRVSIARALICQPEVIICDEVTSALDVSVQASILRLLRRLQLDQGLSMIFVTHNLAVVRNIADRVLVIDGGLIVEAAAVDAVLERPQHAYTRELIGNTPSIEVARPARA